MHLLDREEQQGILEKMLLLDREERYFYLKRKNYNTLTQGTNQMTAWD